MEGVSDGVQVGVLDKGPVVQGVCEVLLGKYIADRPRVKSFLVRLLGLSVF